MTHGWPLGSRDGMITSKAAGTRTSPYDASAGTPSCRPDRGMRTDPAFISALSDLAGVTLGGLTTFATNWTTQRSQLREKHQEFERTKREDLFNAFVTEATRLYGDALSHQKDDVGDLVLLYALVARMRLIASRPVVTAAEGTLNAIIDAYLQPNQTLHEIRLLAKNGGMNFLLDFGEACRAELEQVSGHRVR